MSYVVASSLLCKINNGCICIVRNFKKPPAYKEAYRKEVNRLMMENLGKSPKSLSDLDKLGLSEVMKKNRQYAQYNYQEWRYPKKDLPINISCTRQIIDKMENHEGLVSSLKTPRDSIRSKTMEIRSKRKIKKYVPDFHWKRFPGQAEKIYRDAYQFLNSDNWTLPKKEDTEEKLHQLVTEFAYPTMVEGLRLKTMELKVFENIEAPRVVNNFIIPMVNEDNWYGQVTVRFHTNQVLAVYDRFGRLLFGSPDVLRPVLEYVVFERHLPNVNGQWRIHGKLDIKENVKEIERTVATKRQKPVLTEQKEWHEKQIEEQLYKWDYHRESVTRRVNKNKQTQRDGKYWSAYRKWHGLNVKRTPKMKLLGNAAELTRFKRRRVIEMRKEGVLPKPKKN